MVLWVAQHKEAVEALRNIGVPTSVRNLYRGLFVVDNGCYGAAFDAGRGWAIAGYPKLVRDVSGWCVEVRDASNDAAAT